ncbi:hypothetical protein [Geodermatophilus sp. SYSU D01105]
MAGEFDEDRERTRGGNEVREPAEGTGGRPAEGTGGRPAEGTGDQADLSAEPVGPDAEHGSDVPVPVEDRQADAVPTPTEPIGPGAEDRSDLPADESIGAGAQDRSDVPAYDATDEVPDAGDPVTDQHSTGAGGPGEVPEDEPVDETVEDTVEDPEPRPEATAESVEPVGESDEATEPAPDVDEPVEPVEPVDESDEPVDLSAGPVEPVDDSAEAVGDPAEPVEDSAEPVELAVEPVDERADPVDSSDEPTAPVRDAATPEWFPGEALPSLERLPSAEFQAFLDERHAEWEANLADPRHLTVLSGDGPEVPDPVTEERLPDPVTEERLPDPVTDEPVPDPVTQPDDAAPGGAVAAQFSPVARGDGDAAASATDESVGAERHPESGDQPVGADRHGGLPDGSSGSSRSRRDRVRAGIGLATAGLASIGALPATPCPDAPREAPPAPHVQKASIGPGEATSTVAGHRLTFTSPVQDGQAGTSVDGEREDAEDGSDGGAEQLPGRPGSLLGELFGEATSEEDEAVRDGEKAVSDLLSIPRDRARRQDKEDEANERRRWERDEAARHGVQPSEAVIEEPADLDDPPRLYEPADDEDDE